MSHKHWELVEKDEPEHGQCGNCGYCKCCGRGQTFVPFYPTYPLAPYINLPYTTWIGTGTSSVGISTGGAPTFGGTTTLKIIS